MGNKYLSRIYLNSLNAAIIIYLIIIVMTYQSGGLSFSFLSFNIRSNTLIKPVSILIALFLLKVITDWKWREFSRYLFSLNGIGFCFLVSVSGLASGLFSYDMDYPERILAYISGGIPLPILMTSVDTSYSI